MRNPRTVSIGVGREACARWDLRIFVTYSQIFTVLGLRLLQYSYTPPLWKNVGDRPRSYLQLDSLSFKILLAVCKLELADAMPYGEQ